MTEILTLGYEKKITGQFNIIPSHKRENFFVQRQRCIFSLALHISDIFVKYKKRLFQILCL